MTQDEFPTTTGYQVSSPSGDIPAPPQLPPTLPTPAATPPRQKRSLRGAALMMVGAILGGLIGSAATGAAFYEFVGLPDKSGQTSTTTSTPSKDTAKQAVNISASGQDLTYAEAVAAKVTPSVVSVAIEQSGINPYTGERVTQAVGNGSGVIIRSDGYILTNNHVVAEADSLKVSIGLEELDAKVVGTDPSSDLAVIKVDRTDLPAVDIGSSASLRVGQAVVAIGSPFGLDQSVTTGIISALGRTSYAESANAQLTAYTSLIQTDAAINPGNSGGALTDAEGNLIGINTLIQTGGSDQSAGVGFAIPVDYAIAIADELIKTGSVQHAYLGVSTMTVSPMVASRYNLSVDAGALVQSVAQGSPAEQAGLKTGDIIVKIGNTEIASMADVYVAIRSHKVGETLAIEIVRDGEHKTLTTKLTSDS